LVLKTIQISEDSSSGSKTLRKLSAESTDKPTTTNPLISRILSSSSKTLSEDTPTLPRPSLFLAPTTVCCSKKDVAVYDQTERLFMKIF